MYKRHNDSSLLFLHDALFLPLQKLWVYLINIAFSALAILHLTYLGSVFNSSVDYMEEDEVRSHVCDYIYTPFTRKMAAHVTCGISSLKERRELSYKSFFLYKYVFYILFRK